MDQYKTSLTDCLCNEIITSSFYGGRNYVPENTYSINTKVSLSCYCIVCIVFILKPKDLHVSFNSQTGSLHTGRNNDQLNKPLLWCSTLMVVADTFYLKSSTFSVETTQPTETRQGFIVNFQINWLSKLYNFSNYLSAQTDWTRLRAEVWSSRFLQSFSNSLHVRAL